MISKNTTFMTLQEFTDYAKEWLAAVKNEYKGYNLILTIDDLFSTISARELCEECQGVKEPFQYLDVPVDISLDKADLEEILEEALYFGTDFEDCYCEADEELRVKAQEPNPTHIENEIGYCAYCGIELPVNQMIMVGNNEYICVDDFIDEVVCSMDETEMERGLDLLTEAIVSKYTGEEIIKVMPDIIEHKDYNGGPVVNYDKQEFYKKILDGKYELEDTGALINDLVTLTIIAGKMDIYWEEISALKRMIPKRRK